VFDIIIESRKYSDNISIIRIILCIIKIGYIHKIKIACVYVINSKRV